MAGKSRPFEKFGPYILFKKLESDALGELWRAARLEGLSLGPLLALHRLVGSDREAFERTMDTASQLVPAMSGSTLVKHQSYQMIDGVPVIVHDYAGGRTLRHIVEKGRGGTSNHPKPMAIDQAIAITEKLALASEMIHNIKVGAARLVHGSILPQFTWITEDGEVRSGGQLLASPLVASTGKPGVAKEINSFLAPELRASSAPTTSSDVYSLGSIFFFLLTGGQATDGAPWRTSRMVVNGQPIPQDLQKILERSLVPDPSARYPSATEMKQDLLKLMNEGSYSPTTFNLAFYLNNLLRKELEGETIEREKETKVPLAAYLEEGEPASGPIPSPVAAPTFGASFQGTTRSKLPLIAAVLALVVVGSAIGGYLYFSKPAPVASPATPPPAAPAPTATLQISEPIAAVASSKPELVPVETIADPNADKKAFEAAVNRRLQEELLKLQEQYNRQLQAEAPERLARASTPSPVVPAPRQQDEPGPSAAALDQARIEPQPVETATTTPQTAPAAPVTQTVAPAPVTPAPAPSPAVREGDLVDISEVDKVPERTNTIRPLYPPMAMRRNIEGRVIVTALVSENGKVIDAKVLRGDDRKVGFEEAALRAVRSTSFRPAVKDGKRVRVWIPIPIDFKMN